jgi:hypothetical protein
LPNVKDQPRWELARRVPASSLRFISVSREVARGVTDPGVGSGVLLAENGIFVVFLDLRLSLVFKLIERPKPAV